MSDKAKTGVKRVISSDEIDPEEFMESEEDEDGDEEDEGDISDPSKNEILIAMEERARREYDRMSDAEKARVAEKKLPTDENLSIPEINATENTRNMKIEDMIEKIGVVPYTDWEIRLWRVSPEVWMGQNVDTKRIERIKVGMKWKDLIDRTEKKHGGGTYKAYIHDDRGISRKQKQFEIEGEPLWEADVYPQFVGKRGLGTQILQETEEEAELKSKIRKTKLRQELEDLTGDGKKGDSSVELVRTMGMVMDSQIQMQEQRMSEMERRAEERERRSEERFERLIQSLSERDEGGGSNTANMISMMQKSSENLVTMMIENSKAQQEAERANRQAQMDAMKIQLESDKQRNDMLMQFMMESMTKKDSTLDIMRLIHDSKVHSSEMSMEMLKAILPVVVQGNDVEKSPAVEIAELILGGIDKTGDMLKTGLELKRLQDKDRQLPPIGSQQNPQANRQKQQQNTDGQPVPDVNSQLKAQIDAFLTKEGIDPNATVGEAYASLSDFKRINFVIHHMVLESQVMPKPEESVFVNLVASDLTPELMIDFIMNVRDANELRENFKAFMTPENLAKIDQVVFVDAEKVKWINDCLSILHEMIVEVPEGGTPPVSDTSEDTKDDKTDGEDQTKTGEEVGHNPEKEGQKTDREPDPDVEFK